LKALSVMRLSSSASGDSREAGSFRDPKRPLM
jgi:hypothetical protein